MVRGGGEPNVLTHRPITLQELLHINFKEEIFELFLPSVWYPPGRILFDFDCKIYIENSSCPLQITADKWEESVDQPLITYEGFGVILRERDNINNSTKTSRRCYGGSLRSTEPTQWQNIGAGRKKRTKKLTKREQRTTRKTRKRTTKEIKTKMR